MVQDTLLTYIKTRQRQDKTRQEHVLPYICEQEQEHEQDKTRTD
jgi:hypothetical protein